VIAADNPSDGDYNVQEMDPAALDRFCKIDVDVDVQSWLEYARKNSVNVIVRDFIMNNPSKLHYTPGDQSQKGASPRSWTKLAEYVDSFGDAGNVPEESVFPIIRGKIGSALGAQFYTFYLEYNKTISLKDIKASITKELQGIKTPTQEDYIRVGAFIKELTHEMESITKLEYTNELYDIAKDTLNKETSDESVLVLLGFLYSLDIEVLASVLKEWRTSAEDSFFTLMKFDPKKGLGTRIKSRVQD
jgi:hypothetical protein